MESNLNIPSSMITEPLPSISPEHMSTSISMSSDSICTLLSSSEHYKNNSLSSEQISSALPISSDTKIVSMSSEPISTPIAMSLEPISTAISMSLEPVSTSIPMSSESLSTAISMSSEPLCLYSTSSTSLLGESSLKDSNNDDCDSCSNIEMKSQSDNDAESNSTLTHHIEEKITLNSTHHVISDLDSSSYNSSTGPCLGKNKSDASYSTDNETKRDLHSDDFIPPMNINMKMTSTNSSNKNHRDDDGDAHGNNIDAHGRDDENIPGPSNRNNCKNNNQTNDQNSQDKKKIRPKCKYGKQCYRKNPQHKTEFCHKGDSEYEVSSSEESETDRPQCMYGTACFRKNPDHRKQFSHKAPAMTRKRKKPSKGHKSPNNSPKKKRKVVLDSKNNSKDVNMSSEDSYDYEDPFLNDATEDEFVPTSSLSDSSALSDDSEPGSGEPESNRRLIKEAKRFVKDK